MPTRLSAKTTLAQRSRTHSTPRNQKLGKEKPSNDPRPMKIRRRRRGLCGAGGGEDEDEEEEEDDDDDEEE